MPDEDGGGDDDEDVAGALGEEAGNDAEVDAAEADEGDEVVRGGGLYGSSDSSTSSVASSTAIGGPLPPPLPLACAVRVEANDVDDDDDDNEDCGREVSC